MSVQPFYSPKFRAFDANGNPLSGGLLYSYAAGTTTPLSTYTTRAGDVANANPVVLDANGEADVWSTPNVSYKFVLKSSAGVTQWTVDNVPSQPDLSAGLFDLGDGTVSAPSLSFINDPDCGLYRVGSEVVGMSITGVQKQKWTASGTTITGNVEMAGATPATSTGFTDTITAVSFPKAWVRFFWTAGGPATISAGLNIASIAVSPASANFLRITFTNAFTGTICATFGSRQANRVYNEDDTGLTYFDISLRDAADAILPLASSNAVVSAVFFGEQ